MDTDFDVLLFQTDFRRKRQKMTEIKENVEETSKNKLCQKSCELSSSQIDNFFEWDPNSFQRREN